MSSLHSCNSPVGVSPSLMIVPVIQCTGQSHLDAYFEEVRQLGGDGILMRKASSDYEHGKSAALVKLKVRVQQILSLLTAAPGPSRDRSEIPQEE